MRARVGVTESHREPERDRERSSKSQREPQREPVREAVIYVLAEFVRLGGGTPPD